MRASRPYHNNYPPRYANGSIPEGQMFYEVVGHRDGPVVARFYFTDDESSRTEALAEAEFLCNRNETVSKERAMNADVRTKIYSLIDELGKILMRIDLVSCDDAKDGKSCIHRIGDERDVEGRTVLWYDTNCTAADRLCQACQAYWHIMVARNNVDRKSRLDADIAAEKAREAQRGDPA